MKILLPVFVFFLASNAQAQDRPEINHWHFGENASVDFSSGTPVGVAGSVLFTSEGSASISNADGDLIMYTDGSTLWNSQNLIMQNGEDLEGNVSSTQSAIIIQKPCTENHYYVFTTAEEGSILGLRYSEVDMTLNGGLGGIIPSVKNVFLTGPVAEKVTVIKHADEQSLWVIAHGSSNNEFMAYHVTNAGVNHVPVISATGPINDNAGVGYMKPNLAETKLLYINARPPSSVDLLNIDDATGIISHQYSIASTQPGPYSSEFSPDGNRLYLTYWANPNLVQYDLTLGSEAQISASETVVGVTGGGMGAYFGSLQLGPNGKIYIGIPWNTRLAAIDNPNGLGAACGYVDDAVTLTGACEFGIPNFQMNYLDYDCEDDPEEPEEPEEPVIVEPVVLIEVPNVITANGDGVNDLFQIKGLKNGVAKLTIQNRWGNVVYSSEAYNNDWNPSTSSGSSTKLVEGVYFYILEDSVTKERYSGFVEIRK